MALKKVKCLLKNPHRGIDKKGLEDLIKEYNSFLNHNLFPKPVSNDAISMIHYLKRKDEEVLQTIGPYENITVFEAANRIASDLVILKGILQMFQDKTIQQDSILTVNLGTTHTKHEGDIIINGEHCEAFNVAPTFFKAKLYKTIEKWKDYKDENGNLLTLKYILVNSGVCTDKDRQNLLDKSKCLIIVKDWNKLE